MKTKAKRTELGIDAANETWRRILSLCGQLEEGLHDGNGVREAAARLNALIEDADPQEEAILGVGCRAIICEIDGDLKKAIHYREKELGLIRELHRHAKGKPFEAAALAGLENTVIRDRMLRLARLHRENRDEERSRILVQEAKRYCQLDGIPYDERKPRG